MGLHWRYCILRCFYGLSVPMLSCFQRGQGLESVIDGIKNKKISLGGALEFLLQSKGTGKELLDDKNIALKTIMRPFFAKYDADSTGDIEKSEFMIMLRDLDDQLQKDDADEL